MDEVEWLSCSNPLLMLEFLSGKVSARKLRLFAVAAYRRIRHWVVDPDSRWAIEVAERFVNQQASPSELAEAWTAAHRYYLNSYKDTLHAYAVAYADAAKAAHIAVLDVEAVEGVAGLADLLREIAGNPFRAIVVKPLWLTRSVMHIAQSAYAQQDFDSLPILADALEDALCDQAEVLEHLRSAAPHVHGCWALDWILKKE